MKKNLLLFFARIFFQLSCGNRVYFQPHVLNERLPGLICVVQPSPSDKLNSFYSNSEDKSVTPLNVAGQVLPLLSIRG